MELPVVPSQGSPADSTELFQLMCVAMDTEGCLPGKLAQASISGVFVERGSQRCGPLSSGLTFLCSPSRGPGDTRWPLHTDILDAHRVAWP